MDWAWLIRQQEQKFWKFLDERIKDILEWVLGESAIGRNDKNHSWDAVLLSTEKPYSLFCTHFITERSKHHQHNGFLCNATDPNWICSGYLVKIYGIKKMRGWKNNRSRVNSVRVLSLNRKSTGSKEQKKEAEKSGMTIEVIRKAKHEHIDD